MNNFKKVGESLYRYRNGVYYAYFKKSGKLRWQSLETTDKDAAKRLVADLKAQASFIDRRSSDMTVGALAERYITTIQSKADKTIRSRKSVKKKLLETWPRGKDQRVTDVKKSEVLEWLGLHRERLSAVGWNEYLRFVRFMFQIAVDDRIITKSPVEGIKQLRPEDPERLTPSWEEFKAIVECIRARPSKDFAEETADFIEFMGRFGVGQAEAWNLHWNHIDLERNTISLYRQKTHKTLFTIPIYPWGKDLIKRLKDKKNDERVFKVRDAKIALKKACLKLKFPHYSQRSLRRCFITRCVELGIDFKTIAGWQGHRDGGALIAKTYSHLRQEHQQAMAARLVE